MSKEFEDTTVSFCKCMSLEIKEVRESSTTHSRKEGFTEVEKNTDTRFHWKLRGTAAKLDPESDDFDVRGQETYGVAITSQGYNFSVMLGLKTREKAIKNALAFAKRNGIEVDGYRAD